MTKRIFLHIGLPKTGTTYLQTICWNSRDRLRKDGVLLPGVERRDHLWASRIVREDAKALARTERERTSWDRVRAELASWDGTGLISHEFFAAASAEQAQRMVAELAPAEVHVIVTGREPLGLFTASWQESLKNRSTTSMAKYGRSVSDRPTDIWNWRTLDLRLVLERWLTAVPADRVHVLPLDKSKPRDDIWHRFATLIGLDSSAYDTSLAFPNESMGVVEAETLRRVNKHLHSFKTALDKGTWIRTFLADDRLVPRKGEPFWPLPVQIEDCRTRGVAALEFIASQGVNVIGDVNALRVPEEIPERRTPDTVTDAEVAAAATELVAVLMDDVRRLHRQRDDAPATEAGVVSRLRRWSRLPR